MIGIKNFFVVQLLTFCMIRKVVPKKDWGTIQFDFVSDDGLTPSSVTIRAGDVDPLTGEVVDLILLRKYHGYVNREVRTNLGQIRLEKTRKELQKTRELKAALADQFEKDHGYRPNRDNLQLELEKVEGSPYFAVPYDALRNEDGESGIESWAPFSCDFDDPFEDDLPVEMRALREVGLSLTGRLRDVFDVLLGKTDDNGNKVKLKDLADKWSVSSAMITKDKALIFDLVRKKAAELAEE